jgi:hypothetical protein
LARQFDIDRDRIIERSHKKLSSHGRAGILDGALGLLRGLWNLLLRLNIVLHIDSNIAGVGWIASGTVRMLSLVVVHVSIVGSIEHSEAAQRQCEELLQ